MDLIGSIGFTDLDGGVVRLRVYLEHPALALKLTEPALQLLVIHVLKRPKQFSTSHRLLLLNPRHQSVLSQLFNSFFDSPMLEVLECYF